MNVEYPLSRNIWPQNRTREPGASLGKNSSDTKSERNLLIGQLRTSLKMRGNPYPPSENGRKGASSQQSMVAHALGCCL